MREGLKPNGRDGKDGTGRSPKARRCIAPTRQAVRDFQERTKNMRLLKPALSKHRAMQAMSYELLDDSAHYVRFDFQPHAGLQLLGGMLGCLNVAA
ncbi:hypothetical protein [Aeromonas hydrophila]|uniref:Uncharacterized protein n=1 Tax=Aeromonas hydrophila TaxID=644 RepID=A0AAX3PEN4_AERHY|nr:hypothetical protein [Aeromonas hydrophila]WEE27996.1 hypothetical protein PY771_06655 [Aeromonas hydrophila]